MGKKLFVFCIVFVLLFFLGCVQEQGAPALTAEQTALQKCKELCNNAIAAGTELSAGPCIGNPMEKNPDWVCDIAHKPRQEIDNNPENQCSAYREGRAKHFVELDSQCNLIKTS